MAPDATGLGSFSWTGREPLERRQAEETRKLVYCPLITPPTLQGLTKTPKSEDKVTARLNNNCDQTKWARLVKELKWGGGALSGSTLMSKLVFNDDDAIASATNALGVSAQKVAPASDTKPSGSRNKEEGAARQGNPSLELHTRRCAQSVRTGG